MISRHQPGENPHTVAAADRSPHPSNGARRGGRPVTARRARTDQHAGPERRPAPTVGRGTGHRTNPNPELLHWPGPRPPAIDPALILGRPDAPVTMVEFADYQCPFCGEFDRDVEPALVARYVESGQLQIVWRDFP